MDPSIDGQYVLGTACHVEVIPAPRATQRNTYCGQNGYTILDGGARGGTFRVRGVLVGSSLAEVLALEANLSGFADGNAHTLVDTQGRAWPFMYFPGQYQPYPDGPKQTDFGWCLPYSLVMESIQ
jgi:hypothetical protein